MPPHAQPFDETQHKLLCEELKHLYTGECCGQASPPGAPAPPSSWSAPTLGMPGHEALAPAVALHSMHDSLPFAQVCAPRFCLYHAVPHRAVTAARAGHPQPHAPRPAPGPAAVTRAKNAVVFFDSDPAARAPFYFYLSRLGLARVVTGAPQMVRAPHPAPRQAPSMSWGEACARCLMTPATAQGFAAVPPSQGARGLHQPC